MKKFFKEFKEFISRGNIVDMAVGVIIGTAFTAIVTALTNKILMPVINFILLLVVGGNGMDSIYTFLKKTYTVDANGDPIVDLANSIYIDWGAFIIAIINFILIALVLFCIIKALMRAKKAAEDAKVARATKEELATLKEQGVNVKNRKELAVKLAELREAKKAQAEQEAAAAAEEAKANSTETLLKEIRDLLKENSSSKTKSKKAE